MARLQPIHAGQHMSMLWSSDDRCHLIGSEDPARHFTGYTRGVDSSGGHFGGRGDIRNVLLLFIFAMLHPVKCLEE